MFGQKKSVAACAAGIALVTAVSFTGCSGKKSADNGQDGTRSLRYWSTITSTLSSQVTNIGDTPLMKKAQEITGINVKFEHPAQGQEKEKFNILVASGDYPDIIQYAWDTYPGGPQKAINEKIIIDINEIKDKAPNLMKYLNEHEDVKKLALTDNGSLFSFPFIRGDESLLYSGGLIIRQDWLDELGLEMPETIDDWENVLIAFRDKKGCKAPLCMGMSNFIQIHAFAGAFNVGIGYYVDDGVVKFGMAQPQYKEFLALMNKWYKEKLLDQDFATLSSATIDSNILNGTSGVVQGGIGGGMGRYMRSAPNDKFKLAGAPYPVMNKGDYPEFGGMNMPIPVWMNAGHSAISAESKNKELAAEFLDFGYSDEGRMLYNFGIEGESYEMIDGYPTYTKLITNNPDGLSMSEALSLYTYAYDAGPTIQDKRYMEQYAQLPEQKEAWAVWSKSNMKNHILPSLYAKDNEVKELANLENAVTTYANSTMVKLIMGVESLDNYDDIINELNSRGLQRVLEIKQAAYDRYLNNR